MTTDTLELPPLPGRLTTLTQADIDAIRAYATAAVLADRKRIEQSPVVQFLFGADDLDGVGFSEVPPGKPRFWWRSLLRSAIRNKE